MKLARKWLFPVLTCLIVAGAAVLPARISQAQDAQQFGQIHTETLDAGALPVREAPTLLDRMALFANQYSSAQPVLSSSTSVYANGLTKREQTRALRDLLVEWDIVPSFFFDEYAGASDEAFEHCSVQRLLLLDPAGEQAVQEPYQYDLFAWLNSDKLHGKSLSIDVDAETGLPIQIFLWDSNIAAWLPYTREELGNVAQRYFEMMGWTMGVDVASMKPLEPEGDNYHQMYFSVVGTDLYYWITQGPTTLNISLGGTVGDSSSSFDG